MAELILKEEVYAVVGAAMEVYYKLGIGFLEPIYQETLQIELTRKGIPFEPQKRLELYYKDTLMTKKYRADLVCYGQIIVELKVIPHFSNLEWAQLINYLKMTQLRVGILINFGSRPHLEWKRVAN